MMKRNSKNDTPSWPASVSGLILAQAMAGFSQWIDLFLIFSVPAFLWKSTPPQVAFIASCFALPGLFLGPFIGAALDRSDPRRVAFIAALLRTALTAVIAFASGFGFFAVLVVLKGLANVFYWPATAILTQHLVAPQERVNYFSSLSAIDQITKIITPLIAGAATFFIDFQWVFILSSAMTLGSAAIIRLLPESTQKPRYQKSTKRGLKIFVADWKLTKILPPDLVTSILLGIGMSISLAIYDPHVAAYLNSLEFDSKAFSLLVSSTAVGAVCGALWIRFIGKNTTSIKILRIGIAIFSISISGMAIIAGFFPIATNIAVLSLLWLIGGFGYEMFLIGSSVTMQNLCPPHLLGRVVTSSRSLQMVAVVIGPLIGAWLISVQSRATPFGISALTTWLLLIASIRGFARPAPKSQ